MKHGIISISTDFFPDFFLPSTVSYICTLKPHALVGIFHLGKVVAFNACITSTGKGLKWNLALEANELCDKWIRLGWVCAFCFGGGGK